MSGNFRGNWSSTSNSIAAKPTTKTDKSDQSNRYKFNQHESEIDHAGQSTKSNREIDEYDRIGRVDPITRQLVDGYAQLVADRLNDG